MDFLLPAFCRSAFFNFSFHPEQTRKKGNKGKETCRTERKMIKALRSRSESLFISITTIIGVSSVRFQSGPARFSFCSSNGGRHLGSLICIPMTSSNPSSATEWLVSIGRGGVSGFASDRTTSLGLTPRNGLPTEAIDPVFLFNSPRVTINQNGSPHERHRMPALCNDRMGQGETPVADWSVAVKRKAVASLASAGKPFTHWPSGSASLGQSLPPFAFQSNAAVEQFNEMEFVPTKQCRHNGASIHTVIVDERP